MHIATGIDAAKTGDMNGSAARGWPMKGRTAVCIIGIVCASTTCCCLCTFFPAARAVIHGRNTLSATKSLGECVVRVDA